MPLKVQLSNQVVDVDKWYSDEEYEGFFPRGSREKKLVISNPEPEFTFLLPNYRYLFKRSFERHSDQFWIEIVAYHIGHFMKVPVPPAFVAYSSKQGEYGALIEWFYSNSGERREVYIEGGNIMKNLIKDYDFYKGIQHNFRDISVFIKALTNNKESYNLFINTWAKMFTFDTIIGNTDRHHDNWGLIHYPDEKKGKFSPAFDNGTSMGYEILNDNIPKFNNEEYLMKYINRGTHHARWTINEERNSHASFIEKFLDNYPDSKKSVLECLDFDIDKLMDSILRLTEFSIKTPLEKIRVDFMLKLVRARRDNLLNIII